MKWRLGRGCNGRPLLGAPGLAGARESGNAAQADGDLPIEGQPACSADRLRGARGGGEPKIRRGQARREEWFSNEKGTVGRWIR